MSALDADKRGRGLAETVAVVTGTSPNIGGGIAHAFAEAGAHVACLDLARDVAERCAAAIRGAGGIAVGLACDVSDAEQVRDAFERAEAELGQVRTLVNAAVLFNNKGIFDMTLEEWRRQLDVILTGTFLCTKTAVEAMRRAGTRGAVVNVTSTAGYQGEPGNVCYATAKAGLLNFTRAVAMDVARLGIRVNSLSPSATDPREANERAREWGLPLTGPFAEPEAVEAFLETMRQKVPLGELPTPTDYGRAAVFLASDDARMITGADLRVDAGTVAKHWAWMPGPVGSAG